MSTDTEITKRFRRSFKLVNQLRKWLAEDLEEKPLAMGQEWIEIFLAHETSIQGTRWIPRCLILPFRVRQDMPIKLMSMIAELQELGWRLVSIDRCFGRTYDELQASVKVYWVWTAEASAPATAQLFPEFAGDLQLSRGQAPDVDGEASKVQ